MKNHFKVTSLLLFAGETSTVMRTFITTVGRYIFVLCLVTPVICQAQSVRYLTPSVSIGGIYDDNIFFSPVQKEEDFVLRLSPEVEAGYETDRLELYGLYTFDAEAYADNSDLNDALMRQHVAIDYLYKLSQLLTLGMYSTYDETEAPGVLNLVTGVNPGRNHARRFSIGPSLDYRLNPRTNLGLNYSFTRDKLAGEAGGDTHASGFNVDREINRTNSASIYYTWYYYKFDSGEDSSSHVPMLGWKHDFNARTSFTLAAGPRFTEGSTEMEVALSAVYLLDRGEITVSYDRSESTVIGEAGTANVQKLGAGISYAFSPDLSLQLSPYYTTGRQSGSSFDVYQLDLEVTYKITDRFSIIGSYVYSLQQGNLDELDTGDVEGNMIYMGVRWTMPSWGNGSTRSRQR